MVLARHAWPSLLLLLLASFCCPGGKCWDFQGHERMAEVTMGVLPAKTRHKLKKFLNGGSLQDSASRSHELEDQHPEAGALHFQKQKDWGCALDWGDCEERHAPAVNPKEKNACLLKAARFFYLKLTASSSSALSSEKPPYWLKNWGLTDKDSLLYLFGLIADLHQPLHVGFDGDGCGQEIRLTVPPAPGSIRHAADEETSLYDLWDVSLVDRLRLREGGHQGKVTVSSADMSTFVDEQNEWKEKGLGVLDRWAAESIRLTCDEIYTAGGVRLASGSKIGPQTVERWVDLTEQQVKRAGIRAAAVLEAVFEARAAQRLRIGASALVLSGEGGDLADRVHKRQKTAHGAGKRGEHYMPRKREGGTRVPKGLASLFVNLIVFAAVLGVFALIKFLWLDKVEGMGPGGAGGAGKMKTGAAVAATAPGTEGPLGEGSGGSSEAVRMQGIGEGAAVVHSRGIGSQQSASPRRQREGGTTSEAGGTGMGGGVQAEQGKAVGAAGMGGLGQGFQGLQAPFQGRGQRERTHVE
uniref:Uncharacterized protein n=1 Tax=Chromera velia CCMP2878 TaxID=1169474 RepID=A0A0G4HJN5_9ALVE|eukprot:Cvel_7145.t1-p1 / transcript=Cvel_7145.t1 / gene=Cvel_7145 / organism=Chromera_velia_CCMP2878 / gene_product=Endonuclease 4, putative / transcript_product=Endonuclease 4, putative / location=Cvel_scaffold367:20696-23326(-) / protein_length=524 / sequence_SO=supercontig / SO=protein_coding / is_pseudo=false